MKSEARRRTGIAIKSRRLVLTVVVLNTLVGLFPFAHAAGPPLFRPDSIRNGLQGYWKLNESSGVRMDSSGNRNNLSDVNTVGSAADDYWALGERSADFERDNSEQLTIAHNAQSGLGSPGPFTFYCRFKYETVAGYFVRKFAGNGFYIIVESNGQMRALFNSGSGSPDLMGGPILTAGKWYEMAFVFDGSYMLLYLDGNLVASRIETRAPNSNAGDFILGQGFDGLMKDAAVWNRDLSPLELKSLALGMDLSAGTFRPGSVSTRPTAWWKLNEVSAGTAPVQRQDSTGSHHLSSDPNATAAGAGYLEAVGANFIAVNSEYLKAPDSPDWEIGTGDASIALWVRFRSLEPGKGRPFLGQEQDGRNYWDFFLDYTSLGYVLKVAHAQNSSFTINLSELWKGVRLGTWYHVALVKRGSEYRFYVDGRQLGSPQVSDTPWGNFTGELFVGRVAGNSSFFHDGEQADLAFWKGHALNEKEIRSLATGLPLQQAGVVSYWKLDELSDRRDDSVGNNHLSDRNGVGYVQGVVGNGSRFEKQKKQYLFVPLNDQVGLDFAGQTYSIVGWINPTTAPPVNERQGVAGRGSLTSGYVWYYEDNILRLRHDQNGELGKVELMLNEWKHVAISVFAGPAKLMSRDWYNGVFSREEEIPGATRIAAEFRLGADTTGNYFDGKMDEMIVAKRAFRDEEIKALYNRGLNGLEAFGSIIPAAASGVLRPNDVQTSHLRGYWPLSETNGTSVAKDASGNSYDLTSNGAPGVREGYFESHSRSFDTNDDLLSISQGASPGLRITNEVTLFARIKLPRYPESGENNWRIIGKFNDGSAYGWAMELGRGSGQILFKVGNGTASTLMSKTTLALNRWYDVSCVASKDGSYLRIYLDGRLDNQAANTLGANAARTEAGDLLVGGVPGYYNFRGQIADLAIWDTVLTPQEVSLLSGLVDVASTVQEQEMFLRIGSAENVKLAQGFRVAASGTYQSALLPLRRENGPTGQIWGTIESDSGGQPSGTPIAGGESHRLKTESLSTTASEVSFAFANPPQLQSGAQHWLVLQGDYAPSATVNVRWQRSPAGTGVYPNGDHTAFNGTSWKPLEAGNTDFAFKLLRVTGPYEAESSHANERFELGSNTGKSGIAQNVLFPADTPVQGAAFWMNKQGDPRFNLTVNLRSNEGGVPGGLLGTSLPIATSVIPARGYQKPEGQWVYFEFPSSLVCRSNTDYWICLETDAMGDSANYACAFFNNSSDLEVYRSSFPYASRTSNGPWTKVASSFWDFDFVLMGLRSPVGPSSDLLITPSSVVFGNAVTNQVSSLPLQLVNRGAGTITGTAEVGGTDASPFRVTGGSPFSLTPGQTSQVMVAFSPSQLSPFAARIVFSTTRGNFTNSVSGVGVVAGDDDHDGIPNYWEQNYSLSVTNAADATLDLDGDHLSNFQEFQLGTRPDRADTDGDGMSDFSEVFISATNPLSFTATGIRKARYHYDRNDRLIGAEYSNGLRLGYVYDGNGNILRQATMLEDGNGLPVLWRLWHGLDGATVRGLYDDPDRDGWSNYQEWKAGSNPTNSVSVPNVSGPSLVEFPESAPISRILPEPSSGGSLARVGIQTWDAEGNSVRLELQYKALPSTAWSNTTVLTIDDAAPGFVAANPTGVTHQVIWDASRDLGSGFSGSVQLRARAQDVTLQGGFSTEVAYRVTIQTNSAPSMPSNVSPADGAVDEPLTLTLRASPFSDPNVGDTHAASQWQILHGTGATVIWDSGEDKANMTNRPVPAGPLAYSTTYRWQVRYKDNQGLWGDYSRPTSFKTLNDPPPIVRISSPTSDSPYKTGSNVLSLAGTASDNDRVTQVRWSSDRGGSGIATGTTDWTVTGINLQNGANVITLTASDIAGNSGSTFLTVTFGVSIVGDFDLDGKSDLVFQDTGGFLAAWLMNGADLKTAEFLAPSNVGDTKYRIVASADFNRDGHQDLLFQHSDGSTAVWYMNGLSQTSAALTSPANPGDQNWRVVATADVNKDGRADILWQHMNGTMAVWYMDGIKMTDAALLRPSSPGDPNWSVVGTADVNSDGWVDLLFQHSDGTLAYWLMNGVSLTSAGLLKPSTPGDAKWELVAVGQYDAPGTVTRTVRVDLIFQHTNYDLAVWYLDGTTLKFARLLKPSNANATWRVVAPK